MLKSQTEFLEVRKAQDELKTTTTTTKNFDGLAADLDNAKEKISFGDIAVELSEMKYRENTLKRYE